MPTECNTKLLKFECHAATSAGAGRIDDFRLPLQDLLHDDIEAVMAFDGVLPPESLSFAGRAAISSSLACHNTPERLLDGFLRDRRSRRLWGNQNRWLAQRSCGRHSVGANRSRT